MQHAVHIYQSDVILNAGPVNFQLQGVTLTLIVVILPAHEINVKKEEEMVAVKTGKLKMMTPSLSWGGKG